MTDISVARIRHNLRRMEDSTLVNNDGFDDFLGVCESEFIYQGKWGGLRHDQYADFLAQYCQTSPGETCRQQASNFWNLDLRLQKVFISPGCPQDTELNEQCIDYFLQNNPQTLIYAGNVTQLCESTKELLLTTGLMLTSDQVGDLEQDGRDSGSVPLDISSTSTESPSFAPSKIQEKDEKDLVSRQLMTFLAVIVISGLLLGMIFAHIRKLRHKRRKEDAVESSGGFATDVDRPRMPRVSCSGDEKGSSCVSSRTSEICPPRIVPFPLDGAVVSGSQIKHNIPEKFVSAPQKTSLCEMKETIPEKSALAAKTASSSEPKQATQQKSIRATETNPLSQMKQMTPQISIRAAETNSLSQMEHTTPQKSKLSEPACLVDSEERTCTSESDRKISIRTCMNPSEDVWIVECTGEEEEQHSTIASMSCRLNSVSQHSQHCQLLVEQSEHHLTNNIRDINSIGIDSINEQGLPEKKSIYSTASDREFSSDTTFDFSIRNAPSKDSPALCELVAIVQGVTTSNCESMRSLTIADDSSVGFDLMRQNDTLSTALVPTEGNSIQTTASLNARDDWVSGILETTSAASMSAHTQPFDAVCDSVVIDPPEHDDYLPTVIAGTNDQLLPATIRRNANAAKVLHTSIRTSVDPPDVEADARIPALQKVKMAQHSEFDVMSTCATSLSSQPSDASSSTKPHTQLDQLFDSNAEDNDALSIHSDQLMPPCSMHPPSKVLVSSNFDIVSKDAQSDLCVATWGGNNQTALHHVFNSDGISIDEISNTSQLSVAKVYAIPRVILSQQSNIDDISMDIQSCSSQFSLEGYYHAKPQIKQKRLSGLNDISMDTSSHSTEWSMEDSIRQTFDSFKQNVSHAIAELNDDMHTVDTTSILSESELMEDHTPMHRTRGLDP